MKRWSNYGARDTQLMTEGDKGFSGVNMLLERNLLPEGMLARSENKRLRTGPASTRQGTIEPSDFAAAFADIMVGSAIYSNPDSVEVMLVATKGAAYVWQLQYGKDPIQIGLAVGETTGLLAVEFVQTFEKVFLLRRPIGVQPILVWDGNTANTFDPITLIPPGVTLVETTWHGEPFGNRILLYNAQFQAVPWRDQIIETDIGNYSSFDTIYQRFRINSGQSDWITRVWAYYKGSAVVFKKQSIHLLSNISKSDPATWIGGDPLTGHIAANQVTISSKTGATATKCIVEAGDDLLFLSEPTGIRRMRRIEPDSEVPIDSAIDPVPVSNPIKPLIDRIHWPQAAIWACAETLDDYAYFFFPIDGTGNGCNACAVYNISTGQWESAADSRVDPTFRIHALHVTTYDRSRRLYALDYTAKRVYLLNEGTIDIVNGTVWPIQDVCETRGYDLDDDTSFKRFQRMALAIATSDPQITITALTDGVNEEKVLTDPPLRKDALKFYPHGHLDFDEATGDPMEPNREDYSTSELGEFAGQDFELLPVGPVDSLPGSGTTIQGPKQECLVRLPMRVNGRWASLRVENKSGSCDVLATAVEAIRVMETKTAA